MPDTGISELNIGRLQFALNVNRYAYAVISAALASGVQIPSPAPRSRIKGGRVKDGSTISILHPFAHAT